VHLYNPVDSSGHPCILKTFFIQISHNQNLWTGLYKELSAQQPVGLWAISLPWVLGLSKSMINCEICWCLWGLLQGDVSKALLLAHSLCSFFFSVLRWACWSNLVYNASGTSLKIEVISTLLPVNQHFIAYHALKSKVQSLLTKPKLDSLALTLIRPQNSKVNPKSRH